MKTVNQLTAEIAELINQKNDLRDEMTPLFPEWDEDPSEALLALATILEEVDAEYRVKMEERQVIRRNS